VGMAGGKGQVTRSRCQGRKREAQRQDEHQNPKHQNSKCQSIRSLSSFFFLFIFLLFEPVSWIAGDKEKDLDKE
jgi:hypothetical protein